MDISHHVVTDREETDHFIEFIVYIGGSALGVGTPTEGISRRHPWIMG